MRQKLASVELGSPSLSLMRRNGFSPVRINLCGSATLILVSPCSNHNDCRQSLSASADLRGSSFLPLAKSPGRNRAGGPAFQSVAGKANRRPGMGTLFRHGAVTFVAGFVGATLAATLVWSSAAQAQSDPPGRIGRLA